MAASLHLRYATHSGSSLNVELPGTFLHVLNADIERSSDLDYCEYNLKNVCNHDRRVFPLLSFRKLCTSEDFCFPDGISFCVLMITSLGISSHG